MIVDQGSIVLIRRRFEPLAGRWTLPGGALELGETLEVGVAREILEETGLEVRVGPLIEVFDRITRDEESRVRYHFVLADYLCWPTGGRLGPGSDVDEAVLVSVERLKEFDLTEKATSVIERGLALNRR